MGIHDQVWTDASFAERHILLPHNVPHHTLLTVPAAELVPKFRPPGMPDQHLETELHLANLLLLSSLMQNMDSIQQSTAFRAMEFSSVWW